MNEKVKAWAILGGVSLLTISLIYLFSKPKQKLSPFKKNLVKLANKEFDKWNKNGVKIKEGSKDTIQDLRNYWEKGAGIKQNDKYYVEQAWSSAFISYLMRKAGAGNDFKYAQSHSQYIAEAVKNRKENNSKKFKGYKPNETDVKVGDLVCYPRQSGISYNSGAGYMSHCDLIINIVGNKAVGIGGNVSDSVTKNYYILKDGKIDKSKDKKPYGGVFVVIKNTK